MILFMERPRNSCVLGVCLCLTISSNCIWFEFCEIDFEWNELKWEWVNKFSNALIWKIVSSETHFVSSFFSSDPEFWWSHVVRVLGTMLCMKNGHDF